MVPRIDVPYIRVLDKVFRTLSQNIIAGDVLETVDAGRRGVECDNAEQVLGADSRNTVAGLTIIVKIIVRKVAGDVLVDLRRKVVASGHC